MVESDFLRHAIVEPWDIEGIAQLVLREVHLDGADAPDVQEAVTRLGFLVIRVAVEGMNGWTDFADLIIYCRPKDDIREEIWIIAHELAHIAQELDGLPVDLHDEGITDQIARAILMPEGPYRKLLKQFGAYHPAIALHYPHVPKMQRLIRAAELGF